MELMQEVAPYLLAICALRAMAGIGRKRAETLFFSLICCWSAYESVIGMMQVFGHRPSGHALFAMTGNFQNPGPYGGFIGIATAMAICFLIRHKMLFSRIRPKRIFAYLPFFFAIVAAAAGLIVLPASMSRAGWLAFTVAVGVFLLRETGIPSFLRYRKTLIVIITAVMILSSTGIFLMKKDSAIGRLHIWRMECRAIASHPLGSGLGRRMGAYAEAQEAFFRKKDRPGFVVRAAGCPEYAFNEFLGMGMDTGVPGMLAAIAITAWAIAVLMRERSVFGYGLIACTVFALFSYPLGIPKLATLTLVPFAVTGCYDRHRKPIIKFTLLITAILAIFVIASIPDMKAGGKAEKEWKKVNLLTDMLPSEEIADSLAPLEKRLSGNYRFLYDYGYALFGAGRFRESIGVLEKGAEISSDPMFRNIIGRDLESLGDCKGAEKEYLRSHYMVPCRLYPLILLKEMYEKTGEAEKAASTLEMIRKMYVNPRNLTMKNLAERAEMRKHDEK